MSERDTRIALASRIRTCRTVGCDNLVLDDDLCDRCREEIDALAKMAFERRLRRENQRQRRHELLEALLEILDYARRVDWISVGILAAGIFTASYFAYQLFRN